MKAALTRAWCLGFLLVSLGTLGGCARLAVPTAPAAAPVTGAAVVSASIKDGSYVFMRWNEGLTLLVAADLQGNVKSNGSAAGGMAKQMGSISGPEGRRFDWQLTTTDGKSAAFTLDGKQYDLAKGRLFLVTTKGGKNEVQQLDRDLSAVQATTQGTEAFLRNDPDTSKLLGLEAKK